MTTPSTRRRREGLRIGQRKHHDAKMYNMLSSSRVNPPDHTPEGTVIEKPQVPNFISCHPRLGGAETIDSVGLAETLELSSSTIALAMPASDDMAPPGSVCPRASLFRESRRKLFLAPDPFIASTTTGMESGCICHQKIRSLTLFGVGPDNECKRSKQPRPR